jgi:hypothetical protein
MTGPRRCNRRAFWDMGRMSGDVVGNAPEAYAKIIKDGYEKWGSVIAAAGIKPED